MDGKEVQGVALCGSKMVWKNLHHQSLPSSREIEFSEGGESIVSSTLGFSSAGTGTRVKPAKPEPQQQFLLCLQMYPIIDYLYLLFDYYLLFGLIRLAYNH